MSDAASHGALYGPAAQRLLRPFQAFIRTEASGGIVLVAAAVVALIWANSPWGDSYDDLWHAHIHLDLSLFTISESLGHLVNDGAMTIFFFVVGLEIKRKLLKGELASVRKATLPVAAALGGMVVPALIYTMWNFGTDAAPGWGIPMATDIAFAVGVLALVGPRVPFALKVFLLALAVADDLGAILVIAVFYTDELSFGPLGWAAAILAAIVLSNRVGVRSFLFYTVLGALLWVAVLKSGIHATLAGVTLAALTPWRPYVRKEEFEPAAAELVSRYGEAREAGDHEAQEAILHELERLSTEREAALDRLEHKLLPWASYVIVPLFALSNAGLDISRAFIENALTSPVSLGVASGLVVGKFVGILAASWITTRIGIATLPTGVQWRQIAGVALLGGIGFTVSLFVSGLAFDNAAIEAESKAGIFFASVIAGVAGFLILRLTTREVEAENSSPSGAVTAPAKV